MARFELWREIDNVGDSVSSAVLVSRRPVHIMYLHDVICSHAHASENAGLTRLRYRRERLTHLNDC